VTELYHVEPGLRYAFTSASEARPHTWHTMTRREWSARVWGECGESGCRRKWWAAGGCPRCQDESVRAEIAERLKAAWGEPEYAERFSCGLVRPQEGETQ
jgi:hypothetical protein